MNRVALIIPYFGKLPNYFNIYLDSCEKNKNVDFYFFSDQDVISESNNINYFRMSFEDFNKLVCDKLKVNVLSPYKICDFRPAFAKIFEDYIGKYEFWGFCDCDLIFGNLNLLFNEKILDSYEKILVNGHLTVLKNIDKINSLYKLYYKDIINFIDAIKIEQPCFFDEIYFNKICDKNNIKTFENSELFADILPGYFEFIMKNNNISKQIFKYSDGKLTRINDNKEYIYIHLQKRKMKVDSTIDLNSNIYIYPNILSNKDNIIIKKDRKYRIRYIINYFKRFNINRVKIKINNVYGKQIFKIGGK